MKSSERPFHYKVIKLGVYPIPVVVWFAKDIKKAWAEFIRKFEIEDGPDRPMTKPDGSPTCSAFCSMTKYGVALFFEEEPKIEVIAHESCHAIALIFMNLGIEAKNDNDEVRAYPLGFLVGEIHKEVERINMIPVSFSSDGKHNG